MGLCLLVKAANGKGHSNRRSDPELCFGIIGLFVNKSMPSHREKE